jgi:L-rhamnonate dehydratase
VLQNTTVRPASATRIVSVELGTLVGRRPRVAGSNARLGTHGDIIRVPLLRLTTMAGIRGFGICFAQRDQIITLLDRRLDEVFDEATGVRVPWLAMEYALWDLRARQEGLPVYALLAAMTGRPLPRPFRVPCYDTSLYIDDLHLRSTDAAASLIAAEARDGWANGHRAFKIKVGRGARHMPVAEGTARDIAVIRAAREAVGTQAAILVDANNGYNLNLAKHVLAEVSDCGIGWLEEPFHEDAVLYRDLKEWLERRGQPVLIADGEGDASPRLPAWAAEGLIDVLQYDIYSHGLTRWLATGFQLDTHGTRTAPHHYGSAFGNYAGCHLAAGLPNFSYAEWDEAVVQGLEPLGYQLEQGMVNVPESPGFGLALDESTFQRAVVDNGFRVNA